MLLLMKTLRFTTLPGDGIGPEVMDVAIQVLQKLGNLYDFNIETSSHDVGGIGIDNHGKALPDSTYEACKKVDAILFGSVGGPKWENLSQKNSLRELLFCPFEKALNYLPTFAREIYTLNYLIYPLRSDTVANGIDTLCVRELTGGIYFGQPKETTTLDNGEKQAIDTMVYRTGEIERID